MGLIQLFGRGEGYRSRTISRQRRMNLYLEYADDPDKSEVAMLGTPGLALLTANGYTPARGAHTIGNFTYCVLNGPYLGQLSPSGTFGFLGALNTNAGRVAMADNGTQLLIVDGAFGYIYNLSTRVFSVISDPAFPNGATTACFLNGYFIVNRPNSGQFFWSYLYDGTKWDGLQFATAEASPDNLMAVTADHGVLYLWGASTIEFWAASGDTAVWRRVTGTGIEWGLAALWTIDRFGDDEIFLAKNRLGQFQVTILRGQQPVPISTPDIVYDMNKQTPISGATAFSYMMGGHTFYQINLGNKSYLYDGLSQSWSEVSSAGGRHFGDLKFELLGQSYVCDYQNGNIYLLSLDLYDDNGTRIVREWTSKHVFHDLDRITIDELRVEFEPGVGLVKPSSEGTGVDPQAMLQISRDGGATFGNEHWTSIGALGGYLTRAVWRMLGRARDFVFRVRITEPVKVVISNIALKVRA